MKSTISRAALAVLLLTSSTIVAHAQDKKVLRVAPSSALRLLDPVTTSSYATRNYGYLVFDTLFALDSSLKPQPEMVKEWKVSSDKLSYEFTLREDLRFHDGSPVKAEDCIASITRWAKRDIVGARLAAITKSMTASSDNTFQITLSEPFGPMLEVLAKASSIPLFIMPRRIADTPPDKNISEVIGSGPFRFIASEYRPGVKAVFERNSDYVARSEPADGLAGGKVPKVDRVELIWMPDRQTAINAIRKGDIDLIEGISADARSQLDKAPNIELRRKPGMNATTIRFNWAQPPFDNEDVRKAVQLLISQRDYMDTTVGDPEAYRICGALFSCGSPLASEAGVINTDKPDLAKACALLAKGGYKGEPVVMITAGDNAALQGLAPLTQQILKPIGMNFDVQTMEWSTYLSRRNRSGPASEGGWNIGFAVWDTIDLISPLANPNFDARGKIGYTGFVDDPDMEKMKDAFARETDPAAAKIIAEKIQERAYEKVYYIPLGTYYEYQVFRSNVVDLVKAPILVFWGLDKK